MPTRAAEPNPTISASSLSSVSVCPCGTAWSDRFRRSLVLVRASRFVDADVQHQSLAAALELRRLGGGCAEAASGGHQGDEPCGDGVERNDVIDDVVASDGRLGHGEVLRRSPV